MIRVRDQDREDRIEARIQAARDAPILRGEIDDGAVLESIGIKRLRRLVGQRCSSGSWTTAAVERLRDGAPGYCGYGSFAVSKNDLERRLKIQLAYIREMQMVIAAAQPADCVGRYCAQLLELSVAEDNALRLEASL